MEITVLNGQSIFDLANIVSGSAEAAFGMAFENGISVTEELESGQVLQYGAAAVVVKNVVDYYRLNGICPATGDDVEAFEKSLYVDEMYVNENYIENG